MIGKLQNPVTEIKSFLSHINIPKLSKDKAKLCDEELTERDLYGSLRSMQNDKSPGSNGLTKENYETYWNELKDSFIYSVSETKKKAFKYISKTGRH